MNPSVSIHFLATSQTLPIKITSIRESMNILMFETAPVPSNLRFLPGSVLTLTWSDHLHFFCDKKPIALALPTSIKLPGHVFRKLRKLVAQQPNCPTRLFVDTDFHIPMALSRMPTHPSAPANGHDTSASNPSDNLQSIPQISTLYPDLTRQSLLDPLLKALDLNQQDSSWYQTTT